MNVKQLLAFGSLASLGPVVEFASRFGRNIILAHMLMPSEFGIGAALTLTMGVAETATDIGLDRFLILRADEDRDVLPVIHGISVLRGVVLGLLLIGLAPWAAAFLGASGSDGSFRAVGVIVMLRSCAHLEIKSLQRDFKYRNDALSYIGGHLLALGVAYPAALLFGDHRAVLSVMFVECAGYVAVSHLVAQQAYRIRFTGGARGREAIRYGLPLTINGIGLAILSQLDRAVVSHWFGINTLALYTVILNLTIVPISALSRILGQLGMSFLARHRAHPERLLQLHLALAWAYAVVAGLYALFVAASADFLVPILFGSLYQVPPLFHAILTIIVWMRVRRGAETLMLLFSGETPRLMIANLIACIWPLFALPALATAPYLETVLAALLLGDACSLTAFIVLTRRQFVGHALLRARGLAWSGAAAVIAALGLVLPSPGGFSPRMAGLGIGALLIAAQLLWGVRRYRTVDR